MRDPFGPVAPFPPTSCTAWEDCEHDGLCHDPKDCGGVGPNSSEPEPDQETGAGLCRLVILESPYAGDIERNVAYARAAMRDCLIKGDAPMASHLLYTQPGVLDDGEPEERARGIDAGLAWGAVASATVVYADLGVSRGMAEGIARAEAEGRPVEYRRLEGWQS